MTTTNRSEPFGRLLKAAISSIANCEGKTAPIVEDELGAQIGIAGKTIQRYKAGYLPPEDRTVQILAEACIQRGMMGREWLEAFLHHARYPHADVLLDKLRPIGPARSRPPRVYENLPAPTYSQFVMRETAFAEVLDGLQQRSAAVLIVGMGGNGKTSLAREVAAHCLRDNDEAPRFDAVVWVSDKDRPGTTNLSIVLDELARTLDYPGFTQLEHEEKRREVEQLLRRQKILLVVDNFETITDGALLTWLLRLPEPSKALITTREYRREWRSSWPVELRGMSDAEAWELISERARVLKIDRLISERVQVEPLLAATGGNPKALTITLGLLKYERRPLQQVVDDLYAARGDLFDDLFARAWALLDEAARRVLLAATFFTLSASGEALRVTADVQGFAFDRAIERLADLALLEVQQRHLTAPPRYVLHSLVRAFARAQLAGLLEFQTPAQRRWAQWCGQLADGVGYCGADLGRLSQLDADHDTVFAATEWAAGADPALALRLARATSYYHYIRGNWARKMRIDALYADAAATLGEYASEALALSFQAQLSCRQHQLTGIERLLERLQALEAHTPLPPGVAIEVQHAFALYAIAHGDYACAHQYRLRELELARQLGGLALNNAAHRLAITFYLQGDLDRAEALFAETQKVAHAQGFQRSICFHQLWLARIALDRGQEVVAAALLAASEPAARSFGDRMLIALLQHLTARLHALRSDLPAARASLAEAIDLFERLGMRRELAEARAELARLEVLEIPVNVTSSTSNLNDG